MEPQGSPSYESWKYVTNQAGLPMWKPVEWIATRTPGLAVSIPPLLCHLFPAHLQEELGSPLQLPIKLV